MKFSRFIYNVNVEVLENVVALPYLEVACLKVLMVVAGLIFDI